MIFCCLYLLAYEQLKTDNPEPKSKSKRISFEKNKTKSFQFHSLFYAVIFVFFAAP